MLGLITFNRRVTIIINRFITLYTLYLYNLEKKFKKLSCKIFLNTYLQLHLQHRLLTNICFYSLVWIGKNTVKKISTKDNE